MECRKHLKKSANIYEVNEYLWSEWKKIYCFVCSLTILVKNWIRDHSGYEFWMRQREYILRDGQFYFPKENYPGTFWVNAGDIFGLVHVH